MASSAWFSMFGLRVGRYPDNFIQVAVLAMPCQVLVSNHRRHNVPENLSSGTILTNSYKLMSLRQACKMKNYKEAMCYFAGEHPIARRKSWARWSALSPSLVKSNNGGRQNCLIHILIIYMLTLR